MSRVKSYLTYIILATFPIMSIVDLTDTLKFNLALSDIFVLILGLVWILDIKNFKLKRDYPYFWYFLSIISIFLISNIYNLNSDTVSGGVNGIISEGIKFVISAVYLFIGYNSCNDKDELKHVIIAWMVGLWIFMLYGLYATLSSINGIHFFSFNTSLGDHTRLLGTITDPNAAGTYLTFSFFIVLMCYWLTYNKKFKVLIIITELVNILCLIMTQSRGSWIGFTVGVGIFLIFYFKKLYKLIILIVPMFVGLFLVFINIDYHTNNSISNKFIDRFDEVAEGEGQFIIRTSLNLMSLNMGIDNPILGVGKGNFNLNSEPYANKVYDNRDDFIYKEITRVVPHTTFIGIFAELGILGFLAFTSIFIVLIYKIFKHPKSLNPIIAFAILSFFVQSLGLSLENFRGLWIFMGIALSIQDKDMDIEPLTIDINLNELYRYLFIIIILDIVMFLYTARKIPNQVVLEDGISCSYEFNVEDYNSSVNLIYYITGSIDIEIYENNELISEKSYINADGFVKTDLMHTYSKSNYKIIFKGTGEGRNILKNLYCINGHKKYSLIGYKYLPPPIEKMLYGKNILSYRDYTIKNSKKIDFPLDLKNYTILDVRLNNLNNQSEIEFDIKVNEQIDKGNYLNIVYSTDNIENLINNKNKYTVKYNMSDKLKDVPVGGITTFKAVFKGENVEYNVNANVNNQSFYIGKVKPNSISLDRYLKSLDENKLIVISIKDEGTKHLNSKIINELRNFKFTSNLIGKTRYSYIAIGSKDDSVGVYEELKDELIEKSFGKGNKLGDYEIPFDIQISSAGYTTGNVSSIVIDGEEYSKKSRGMNIVVYDMELNIIVDSVNFDIYDTIYK